MPIKLTENPSHNILEMEVRGKLMREDYLEFVPRAESLIQQHGKLRILFVMRDFHGWKLSALWDELRFDFKHFDDIERIAMLGDAPWEKTMSEFCRPFTTATVRYFDLQQIDEARAWLEEIGAPESKSPRHAPSAN